MARKRRRLPKVLHTPAYFGVRAAMTALGALPLEGVLPVAAGLARAYAAAPFNRKRLARAQENLGVAFPELSNAERARLAVSGYEHLFMLAAEAASLPRLITADAWPAFVRLGDVRGAIDRLLSGRPAILLTGHCGNWELLGYTLSVLDFPIHALYRPLDLKPLDEWVQRSRARRGLVLVGKFGAGEELPAIMAEGALPGFVADQNAGDRGLFVPFFGRLASTYKTIGLLAMHAGAPIICGMARRLSPAERTAPADAPPTAGGVIHGSRPLYRLEITDIIDPQDWARAPDPLFYITARYRRAIEAMVRLAPEQYLWMHRSWKSRPRHERLGRPFPGALRDKLLQLPWMTSAELERIEEHSRRDAAECAARATPPADSPEPAATPVG